MQKRIKNFISPNRYNLILATLLFTSIVGVYFYHSLQFSGPAYLSDEVSYISKAAAIAGNSIDAGSSWHAGYPFLISPVFLFVDNPFLAWKIILFINAVMWGLSFMSLTYILRKMFLDVSYRKILLSVSLIATFPAWISMSGYAFSTTAFVFIFMLSMVALVNYLNRIRPLSSLLLFCLTSAYAFWIHPTGLLIAVAAIIFLLLRGLLSEQNRLMYVMAAGVTTIIVLIYSLVVHDLINAVVTPDGFAAWQHYNTTELSEKALLHPDTWLRFLIGLMGRVGYLLVGSFGVLVVPVFVFFESFKSRNPTGLLKKYIADKKLTPLAYSVLIMFSSVIVTSLVFSLNSNPKRVDQLMYGRYIEVFILPVLGMAFMLSWKIKHFLAASCTLFITAISLNLYTSEENTRFNSNNLVNIQSFWPVALLKDADFLIWFLIGGLGIVCLGIVAKIVGKYSYIAVVPFFILAVGLQNKWHQRILDDYSTPSQLWEYVDSNYSSNDCMGFEYDGQKILGVPINERIRLESYYLFAFNFKRMEFNDWYEKCSGPYLTAKPDYSTAGNKVMYIARDINTGLYVIQKSNDLRNHSYIEGGGRFYVNRENPTCVEKGCFNLDSNILSKLTGVGARREEYIYTTGNGGALFYGPYYKVQPGKYLIILDGDFYETSNFTRIYIKSNKGSVIHLEEPVNDSKKIFSLDLKEAVQDIEISINVGENDNLRIKGYSLSTND